MSEEKETSASEPIKEPTYTLQQGIESDSQILAGYHPITGYILIDKPNNKLIMIKNKVGKKASLDKAKAITTVQHNSYSGKNAYIRKAAGNPNLVEMEECYWAIRSLSEAKEFPPAKIILYNNIVYHIDKNFVGDFLIYVSAISFLVFAKDQLEPIHIVFMCDEGFYADEKLAELPEEVSAYVRKACEDSSRIEKPKGNSNGNS